MNLYYEIVVNAFEMVGNPSYPSNSMQIILMEMSEEDDITTRERVGKHKIKDSVKTTLSE